MSVARGATSHVWKAHDRVADRQVAIKFLIPDQQPQAHPLAFLKREVQALRRLQHPHIIRVVDAKLSHTPPFLVMEFVEGMTLSLLLKQRSFVKRPLDLDTVAQLAIQIGEACAYAHGQGVIHRDLKPQNIIIVERAGVFFAKVVDFGVSRLVHRPGDVHDDTTSGRVYGTIHYMAPERIRNEPQTHQVDVFALATLIFELLTGYRCFVRSDGQPVLAFSAPVPKNENGLYDVFRRIVREERVDPTSLRADTPADWAEVILRGLDTDPARRPEIGELMQPFRTYRALRRVREANHLNWDLVLDDLPELDALPRSETPARPRTPAEPSSSEDPDGPRPLPGLRTPKEVS
ncbi:MAG: serine/threonine-protein kinase [Myxococcota bacterium]